LRLNSAGASAVKEPGYFEVGKSFSQVTLSPSEHSPDALFPQKKSTTFSGVALKTQAANAVSPSK